MRQSSNSTNLHPKSEPACSLNAVQCCTYICLARLTSNLRARRNRNCPRISHMQTEDAPKAPYHRQGIKAVLVTFSLQHRTELEELSLLHVIQVAGVSLFILCGSGSRDDRGVLSQVFPVVFWVELRSGWPCRGIGRGWRSSCFGRHGGQDTSTMKYRHSRSNYWNWKRKGNLLVRVQATVCEGGGKVSERYLGAVQVGRQEMSPRGRLEDVEEIKQRPDFAPPTVHRPPIPASTCWLTYVAVLTASLKRALHAATCCRCIGCLEQMDS